MKFNKKRGFTIVELIIVIALIAILAAVLIPVFSNLIQQGKDADSKVLVNTLNKGVAMSGKNDYDTMHEVLAVVEQNVGVDVAKLNAAQAKGNTILWDSTNKTFVFLKSDGTYVAAPEVTRVDTAKYNLWKISDNTADLTDENGYSIYWTGENLVNQKVVNGFDAGKSEITSIVYKNETTTAKNVVIRTNSYATNLEVNGYVDPADNTKGDVINHYGLTGELTVTKCAKACYHENGNTAYATVVNGKVVAKQGGTISVVLATTNDAIIAKDGGEVVKAYKEANVTTADESVELVEATEEVVNAAKDEAISNGLNTEMSESNRDIAARVGTKFFDTLQGAYEAAQAKDTIVLNKDIVLAKSFVVTKELILDLNGKTISNTTDIWSDNDWSLISVQENGNLTITGNGIVRAKENDCYAVDVQDGAKCTIENGEFISNVHAVYVLKGELTVNGGKFSIQQKYPDATKANEFVLNCYDANRAAGTAKIVVKGGIYDRFNPADCYAEGAHTNFVAAGYVCEKIENGFVSGTEKYDAYVVKKAN